MSEKPKIKIFISAHKPTDFVHDEIFKPIQVGCALKKERLPGFLYDNEGENISEKNPRYCELTAQYWAWKNEDADYYGFFHYRRYLSFSEKKIPEDAWGNIVDKTINETAIKKYGLNGETIQKLVQEYDIIVPETHTISEMPTHTKDVRSQYESSGYLHGKDLDVMLKVLQEKYPGYVPYAESFLAGNLSTFGNMYIMKKEIFDQYCTWLFDILDECDERLDYTDYSTEAIRTMGHLAERLFNIYLNRLKDTHNYKIKELPTVIFFGTDPLPKYEPAFRKDNVALAFAINDSYVPYFATLMESIRVNANSAKNYDLLVMHTDVSTTNQERLKRIIGNQKSFSVRFLDLSRYSERMKKFFLRGHFTIETWFRLLMPEILPNYDKILYLDSDLVTNADVAELYNTEVDNYLMAACRDADTAGLYNGAEASKKNYIDKVLELKGPFEYFQAGVVLFNLKKFREDYNTDELLELAAAKEWELLDQDVLNKLAQGKVKYVDMAWNVLFDWKHTRITDIISHAPQRLYNEYLEARKQPKIIHFAGPDKPWRDLNADFAEMFWKYAQGSGYYEQLLTEVILHPQREPKGAKVIAKKFAKKVLPKDSSAYKWAQKLYSKIK